MLITNNKLLSKYINNNTRWWSDISENKDRIQAILKVNINEIYTLLDSNPDIIGTLKASDDDSYSGFTSKE